MPHGHPPSALFPYTTLFRSVVHYAIADPASFVTPGGALDAALADRGVTFYGPDSSITLHPKMLSEGAASLLAGQSRPACLRSEEHTSELQSRGQLVCRLPLE